MSNFTDALADAARSGVCQLLGVPQYLNDMTTRLSGGLFTPPLSQIPNLWRRALCDTDAPEPDPAPFTGGQCACDSYRVTFQRSITGSTQNQQITTIPLVGPVLGIESRQQGGGTVLSIVHGVCSGGMQTGTTKTDVSFTGALDSFNIVSVENLSGSDNCGDPPPVYEEPTPEQVEIPRDVTYNNNFNVPITIPVVFVYARAQVDVNANITIPFTLNLSPTLNITGTVNVDGSVNFNFGGGTATSLPKDPRKGDCDDIAIPDGEVPEDPTESDQPPEPERDREETIIGVVVTVTALSRERASLIVQNDNPDIYAPSLGFVQFLCRVGEVSGAWTSDIPVKNRRNWCQCPWDGGAIAVRGTPQPGVTWTLTPVTGYAGIPVDYITA